MSTESPIQFIFTDLGVKEYFVQFFAAEPDFGLMCAHLALLHIHQRKEPLTPDDIQAIGGALQLKAAKGDRFAEAGLISDGDWQQWTELGHAYLQLVTDGMINSTDSEK